MSQPVVAIASWVHLALDQAKQTGCAITSQAPFVEVILAWNRLALTYQALLQYLKFACAESALPVASLPRLGSQLLRRRCS